MAFRKRNGKWHFRYDITDAITGKRKQKETPGYATKKEATQDSLRILSELENGTYFEEKNITFNKFAEKWIVMYGASGRVKNSTIRLRTGAVKKMGEYFGALKLKEISKLMYQSMLDDLKAKSYAKRTVALVHEAGPQLFRKAVELEMIKTNPTVGCSVPVYQETVEDLESGSSLPKYMERDELALFLKFAKEEGLDQDYAIFVTLAYTGLRVGELCALKWKDIEKVTEQISITKTLYYGGKIEDYELNTPKTKASQRVIDTSNTVLAVLDRHSLWQKEFKMLKRKTYTDKDFVFISATKNFGYPAPIAFIKTRMKRLLKLAGLPLTLSPHALRHTHVSLLAAAGVDLEVIQKRLGHKNDRVTREVYRHVTKKQQKEAPNKFDELMGSQ